LLEDEDKLTFKLADTNRSGTLSSEEVKNFLKVYSEEEEVEDWKLEYAVWYFDEDGDGETDLKEWREWVHY